MKENTSTVDGVEIIGPVTQAFSEVLTPEALRFVRDLAREFGPRRLELLERRKEVQARIDGGTLPDFLQETREIREGDWRAAPVPDDLQDRRVEITGPVDRKMIINALNCGANAFMADFEDSHAPTWQGNIEGQINLRDAVNRNISFASPEGKQYTLNEKTATLIVRPRGWHLVEKHLLVDGEPISAGIFDFGLYFYHNMPTLMARGSGPYFYLPKMESHLEARLWNDIFVRAQKMVDIPPGTIKATVLIETILAAFEVDEIIYELKDHMAGLNCGRWDYIFSFIKRFKNVPGYLFPDRAQITMTRHCMHAYSLLVIKTCHRRGVHAMGGMAAQIPIKNDSDANAAALQKVRDDKIREARDGHDGTWVAHPGLVAIAKEEFDQVMTGPNQIDKLREDVTVTAADLLRLPKGTITWEGLCTNIDVGVQYLANWLSGLGCVPIYNLMEDAATAEISRAQVWQWIHHPEAQLVDGRKITLEMCREILTQELDRMGVEMGDGPVSHENYQKAARLFDDIIASDELEEFLTLKAYEHLD
ncbi:MAG: malate synthase A [bacterium]|nr:malate synthase A [bacterium]